MKTISKESEILILDAIQDVCDHVNKGTNPTDSVVKVAEDRDLNKNFIRLVCTGYNTGATTYQREKGAGVLEKLADFPIANTEKAIDALYPSKILSPSEKKAATVISDDYLGKQAQGTNTANPLTIKLPRGHELLRPWSNPENQKTEVRTISSEITKHLDHGAINAEKLKRLAGWAAGAAGVGALGLGGYGLYKYLNRDKDEKEDKKKKKKRHDKKAIDMKLDYGIEKVSREIPREEQLQHAMNQRGDLQRKIRDLQTKYANSQDILMASLGELGDYFKQANYDWSFEEVDSALSNRYGKAGKIVMDYVFDRNGSEEKRAQDTVYKPVNWEATPFRLAVSAIKQAQAVNSLATEYERFYKEADEKVSELYSPFCQTPASGKVVASVLGKVADDLSDRTPSGRPQLHQEASSQGPGIPGGPSRPGAVGVEDEPPSRWQNILSGKWPVNWGNLSRELGLKGPPAPLPNKPTRGSDGIPFDREEFAPRPTVGPDGEPLDTDADFIDPDRPTVGPDGEPLDTDADFIDPENRTSLLNPIEAHMGPADISRQEKRNRPPSGLDKIQAKWKDRGWSSPNPLPSPPSSVLGRPSSILKGSADKRAGIFSSVIGSSIAGSKGHAAGTVSKIDEMARDLEDPGHTAEMRGIEARTMIQDFLINDEVISGYDPDEVITAYNEISKLSPRVSVQPAIMRPLLRKRLSQGSIEPFEAAEIAEMEKSMRGAVAAPAFRE